MRHTNLYDNILGTILIFFLVKQSCSSINIYSARNKAISNGSKRVNKKSSLKLKHRGIAKDKWKKIIVL